MAVDGTTGDRAKEEGGGRPMPRAADCLAWCAEKAREEGGGQPMPLVADCLAWCAEAVMVALLLLAIFTPAWAGDSAPPVLLVAAAPGSAMPALAVVNYGAGRQAMILYPGGKADAQALVHELQRHGVEIVEELMVPAYSPCHKGTEALLEACRIQRATLTDKSRSPADFSALTKAASEGRITLCRVQPEAEEKTTSWRQQCDGWEWSFQRWRSGSSRCALKRLCGGADDEKDAWECRMDAYPTGEFVVTLRIGTGRRLQRLLAMPRCSVVQLHSLELPADAGE